MRATSPVDAMNMEKTNKIIQSWFYTEINEENESRFLIGFV